MSADLSRRDQRSLILHLLYAMDSFDYEVSLESIVDNFERGFECVIGLESDVFRETAAIIAQRDQLDEIIKPLLSNWRFDRLGCCTRLVMRLGLWELMNTQTPPSVIINEAVELAKCFAEQDAHKFVNGVLDEWVKRSMAMSSDSSALRE